MKSRPSFNLRSYGLQLPIVAVAALALVSLTLLAVIEFGWRRQVDNLLILNDNLLNARVMLANSYVVHEQLHAGNSAAKPEQMNAYLYGAINRIDDALIGRSSMMGRTGTPPTDIMIRSDLEDLKTQIMEFHQGLMITPTTTAALDRRITFQTLMQRVDTISSAVVTQSGEALRSQNGAYSIFLFVWILILGLASVILTVNAVRRTQVEKALLESESRFRSTFNNAAVGIVHTSLNGRLLRANPHFCEILGYTEAELVNRAVADITHSEDGHTTSTALSRLVSGQARSISVEKRYLRSDGSSVWAAVTAAIHSHPDGSPAYIITIVEDITRRKQAEADRDDLLQREQQARSAAEAASRAKDQLLAVVSHELRTPLTPISMGISLLLTDDNLTEDQRETLAMMRRNIDLESRIVSDLLDVARIANRKLHLQLGPVNVHSVIRHVHQTHAADIETNRLGFNLQLDAAHTIVHGDSTRVTQILLNLVSNAIKFTPSSGDIRIVTSNPTPETIRVEVIDNGIGIEPELMQRLFRPFEQRDVTTTRNFGGLGLGLSLARSLAQYHQGTLTASSEGTHRGSHFVLELPVMASALVENRPLSSPPSHPAVATPRMSILVVEDNADTLDSISRVLTGLGHRVLKASSASAALDLARAHQFSIILSDIGLPDLSGWELLRQLRTLTSAPAIALSGFATDEDTQRSLSAGFITHLSKPVPVQTLELVLSQMASSLTVPVET